MTAPAAASLEVELALVRRLLGARPDEPTGVVAARVMRERSTDLRSMSDQEFAEHTLALHGQLEQVSRERARRWQAAEADRAARGVAWCEDGEHEVPIADIIRGQGDYDDVCKACGEANRRQFDAATFAHTDSCPGGTVRTGRGVKVVCDWSGKGTDVIADPDDGPTCPRCDRALEELRDDVTRDAELRARGADPAKVRELAAEMDAATFDREVLGVSSPRALAHLVLADPGSELKLHPTRRAHERATLGARDGESLDDAARRVLATDVCACGYPVTRKVHTGGEHCPTVDLGGEG